MFMFIVVISFENIVMDFWGLRVADSFRILWSFFSSYRRLHFWIFTWVLN